MAQQDEVIVNCPDIPACPDFPDHLDLELSEMDRIVYLAGQALNAHIQNKTDFVDGHYPYDKVGQICATWARATLHACGGGGSSQGGGSGPGGNTPPFTPPTQPGGNTGFSCGTSTSGSGTSCTGKCTANPVGGQSPYTYQWSSGETTKQITNKCSGTYSVTCKD
jgi:hypothetical protein